MNLLTLAESDLAITLEDSTSGFGRLIKLTDDSGNVHNVYGQVHRVGVDVDPGTGATIIGNRTSVTVRLSSLPTTICDDWGVDTADITGSRVIGYVMNLRLDRTLGIASFEVKR